MKLQLKLIKSTPLSTISGLYIDGVFECFVLEDPIRPKGVKVAGNTAIPAGEYAIIISFSPRFKRELPLLVGVDGFEGIRIHPGNTPDDTEGCLLPGTSFGDDRVNESRKAFEQLWGKLNTSWIKQVPLAIEVLR